MKAGVAHANVETGRQRVPRPFWQRCDQLLGANGTLIALYERTDRKHRAALAEADQTRAVTAVPGVGSAGGAELALAGFVALDAVPHWMNMLRILAASHDAFGPRGCTTLSAGN
ncbi:hypothetical protein [Micromonospora sp. DPT]|uniref:hypothetical protein n=1 Tax=Micromonospora sp. DPT TaxID=3142975 RepID=UPI003209E8D2